MCTKDNNRSCVKLKVARHLLRSCTEKIRIESQVKSCQVGTLCQSQEFMPQVTGDFFMLFLCL